MTDRTCERETCSMPIPPKGATGPRATYCSQRCRDMASYARRREAITAAKRAKTKARLADTRKACPACGINFAPTRVMRQKYCSEACSRKYRNDHPTRFCAVPGCDRQHAASGLCQMHWRRKARAEGREPSPKWDERRRANWAKRDALKRGAAGGVSFAYSDVFERDGWVCGICREAVDVELVWPDSYSASLDHIVPLSKGGSHSPDNAQCAHLVCNISKGNRA